MQKKIADTTVLTGLGNPCQTKLLEVPSGAYAGRRVALLQTSANEIKLTHSDSPASAWTTPQTVASDGADTSFDCKMDSGGDIYVVYSEQSTVYLVARKLTFDTGSWSVGSKVTVYSGSQCYDPSLAIAPDGTLWVSWSRFQSPTRRIHVKSSTDGGTTWGSGPSDSGTQLSNSSTFAWSRVIIDNNSVHVIYNDQDTKMSIRSRALSGGDWSSEYNIATGSSFDQHFDAAVGADGRVGLAYNNDELCYREYDGSNWGAVATLDSQEAVCPQLFFRQNIPAVIFLRLFAGAHTVAMYTERKTGSFSTPATLDNRAKPFDAVILYDASSETYGDLTAEAESSTTGDVQHSESGCLLNNVGDVVYLGMDARFRYARFLLSTPGVGGTVLYSYWDGANWQAFTPSNGASDLTDAAADLLFWTDYGSIPTDWQKCVIDSQSRFWIKIEVSSSYATGPVGSQLSAVSEINRLILRR